MLCTYVQLRILKNEKKIYKGALSQKRIKLTFVIELIRKTQADRFRRYVLIRFAQTNINHFTLKFP